MSFSSCFNPKIPIFKGNLVATTTTTTTTTNSTFPSQILLQKPYRNHIMNTFDKMGSSFMRIGSIPDLRIGIMVAEVEHEDIEEEEYGRGEMKDLMERLEILLERIRVFEMEKFIMGRAIKGEISDEVRDEAEKMSRELVNKFLEKPMKYLSCNEVNLEDRLKDLNIVVEMLESSCSGKKKKTNILSNGQCLRHLYT